MKPVRASFFAVTGQNRQMDYENCTKKGYIKR
jgi:hypothetical protein